MCRCYRGRGLRRQVTEPRRGLRSRAAPTSETLAESSTCFGKAQHLLLKNAFRVVIIAGRITFEQFCRTHAADTVAGPALLTEQPRRSPLPTAQSDRTFKMEL